jgi:GNAT superfamily N-acetyltransferase
LADERAISVEVRPVAKTDAALLQALFERADVPCYCQYWQYPGDHRDWQNRCANERDENSRLLEQQLRESALFGFVAIHQGQIVGWARLEEPEKMKKLYDGRLYRGLPCFSGERTNVRAIACFLVDPELRKRGVANSLLVEIMRFARQADLRALEAFPRGATDVSDGEQWMGPLAIYQSAGFETVRDFGPYPVLRLELSHRPQTSDSEHSPVGDDPGFQR